MIKCFLVTILFLNLLSFFSCSEENKKNEITAKPENDTLTILKLSLDSILYHGYYDVSETKDHLGKYRVLCEQPGVKKYLSELLKDSVVFIDKDRLCSLEHPPYYVDVHDFKHVNDSANVMYWVQCIFMNKDTCSLGGMCGGSASFEMKKNDNKWIIVNSSGSSD